jgi:aerobic carbon-monoxide dehydrogenase small subunit
MSIDMPLVNVPKVRVTLTVNGERQSVLVHPMARLLDVLRQELELTGTKEGCGEGECGACSVFLNGDLVNSCLVPVLQADGAELVTIEGISRDKRWQRLQRSFIQHGGSQCGICTPGMILAAVNLLQRIPNPLEADIRQSLAGNLCRCTGYVRILDAVAQAAKDMTAAS